MRGGSRCGSLNCCQHEWREDLAAKDAEIAKLREALEGCCELTYRPIALTTHLNKALEAGQ